MFVNNLTLHNFRNIEKLSLSFDNSLTIFYGENGQGKTNIVESIFLLANASSFRTNYFKELINNEKEETCAEAEVLSNKRKDKFKMVLRKNGKLGYVNDIVVSKFSDYIGKFNAICFSPEDVSMFKDSPGIRRHFLDKELSALFPVYIKQLIALKSVLEERNNLLKGKIDETLLEVINDKLIEASYDIFKRRKWLINKISEFATVIYKILTNESQEIKIVYQTFLDETNFESYISKAKEIYKKSLRKDIERMYTIYGVHKDDFKVYLNDMEIDMYASQGQQRLGVLVLKLSEIEIFNEYKNTKPILLLDDVFSELDNTKKNNLLFYIDNDIQTIITTTELSNLDENLIKRANLIKIKNGKKEEV
jgi:DNA replication and repair protein RecF